MWRRYQEIGPYTRRHGHGHQPISKKGACFSEAQMSQFRWSICDTFSSFTAVTCELMNGCIAFVSSLYLLSLSFSTKWWTLIHDHLVFLNGLLTVKVWAVYVHTGVYLTVEDGGRVMEKWVGGKKEQIGGVWPRHGVEDQLPCALRHLGSIFGHQLPPVGKRLQGQSRKRNNSEWKHEEGSLFLQTRSSASWWEVSELNSGLIKLIPGLSIEDDLATSVSVRDCLLGQQLKTFFILDYLPIIF